MFAAAKCELSDRVLFSFDCLVVRFSKVSDDLLGFARYLKVTDHLINDC